MHLSGNAVLIIEKPLIPSLTSNKYLLTRSSVQFSHDRAGLVTGGGPAENWPAAS